MHETDELKHLPRHAVGNLEVLLTLNVMRTHSFLSPFIDRSLTDLKLHAAQFNVLLLLYAEREAGLPLGEIGRRLVVTKANVTGLVDRLERKGFVERGKQADRRVTVARLTAEGVRVVKDVLPAHKKLACDLVDCLSDLEKRQLIKLLTKLRRGLREKWQCHCCSAKSSTHSKTSCPRKRAKG